MPAISTRRSLTRCALRSMSSEYSSHAAATPFHWSRCFSRNSPASIDLASMFLPSRWLALHRHYPPWVGRCVPFRTRRGLSSDVHLRGTMSPGEEMRVLIVEDEAKMAGLIRKGLRQEG